MKWTRLLLFALLDRWRSPPPKPAKVDWLRGGAFAHRGLHGAGVPENSASAFAAAMARGLGIECDVQRSRDGRVVVFHDTELDRLTAETGPVAARTAAQLGQIALAGSSDTVPTLRQLLDQLDGTVPVLIEIKSDRDRAHRTSTLCLAVRRELEGYVGPYAVMSFDPRIVRWFADHSPLTVRGLVITEQHDRSLPARLKRRFSLWHARPDFLAYDIRDLPSRFAAAQRARGLPLLSWTVRTADLAMRAAQYADAPIAEGGGVDAQAA